MSIANVNILGGKATEIRCFPIVFIGTRSKDKKKGLWHLIKESRGGNLSLS
jgi:hypothetical protein